MSVVDTGRADEYDFSHQTIMSAINYEVGWRVFKLRIGATETMPQAIALTRAYIDAAPNNLEKYYRTFRVSRRFQPLKRDCSTPEDRLLVENYCMDLLLDGRELKEELFGKGRRSRVAHADWLVWDWNLVRTDLRKLFKNNPGLFADMRRAINLANTNSVSEEANYFVWLCDEETYVPKSVQFTQY